MSFQWLTKLVFNRVIAHWLPAVDEITLLRATRRLTCGAIMGVDMRRPVQNCGSNCNMTLQPLVQIAGLGNIDGNPIAIPGQFGINKVARLWLKNHIEGINLIEILLAGLPRPIELQRGAPRLRVRAK